MVAAAALPAKVEALRNYLGEAGKPLTATGNLKLADGRALVELRHRRCRRPSHR